MEMMTHEPTGRRSAWSSTDSVRPLRMAILGLLVILIVAVAGMGAYIYAGGQPKVYGGQFKTVYENGQATSADQILIGMQTQKALAESAATLQPVADQYQMSLQTLTGRVSASVDGTSNVLTVTVSDPDATRASGIARAVAASYMKQSSSQNSTQTSQARALIQRKIVRLTAQLRRLQDAAATDPTLALTPTGQSQVLAQTQALLGRIGALEDQLTQLDIQNATGPRSEIITPAHLLADPLKPQPIRTAVVAVIAGIVLAGLVVLVASRPRRDA